MYYFIIRYAEIALKGSNRQWFENKLIGNLGRHFKDSDGITISRIHGRIILSSKTDDPSIGKKLSFIPGIENFSKALTCSHDLDEISQSATAILKKHLQSAPEKVYTFKVVSQRSDKNFPLNSMELSAKIGGSLFEEFKGIKAQMVDPEILLGIEIWSKNRAVVFLKKSKGQGGLPVGTSGRVLSFLSGGIDSPVASWFMMKRGCETVYLNFHSYPFIGEQSKQKVIELVKHLSRFQPESKLIVAPFAKIQKAVKENCAERYRTLLYRRMMNKVADGFIKKLKIKAFVTGEAVGQVASQTLENIHCTEESASLPVLRPLIGMEKAEIIQYAKKIGTYEISIQPFQDCCTVFQPKSPATHANVGQLFREESRFPFAGLIEEAIKEAEITQYSSQFCNKFWD
ncbi:MAG: tRNA 4-thiouridine(8) synthase ThiI [Deltaproteobacteria bacterium]|nr:tRNA 4-thiouridine(8) synthase ThiI [Deltaproteobacteria bacterium]